MSMDGLRRGAQGLNNNKGGKGGGVRSVFYTRWKPPQIAAGAGMGNQRTSFDLRPFLAAPPSEESKVEAAEPVVLIPGQYEDVYATLPDGSKIVPPPIVEGHRFRVHSFNVHIPPRNASEKGFNSFKELVCSCGPDAHAPQPCVGCYQYDHGDKNARSKDQWAFNLAHLAWYHMIPLVKDGQVVMKKDNSGPVMVKQECLRHKMENVYLGRAIQSGRVPPQIAKKYKDCEGCKQSAQWAFGDHRVIQLGFKHLKNLFDIDDQLGKKCLNCNTGILRVAFDCEKCNTEMLDLSQVQWTNDQIDTFSKTPTQCQSCGNVGVPKSVYECGFDENYNQVQQACANPQKTTIFDCVLWLQREGESTESEIVVKRIQLISQYQAQHDQRSLGEQLKEIVKEPFNLVEMYKPDTLDEQAEMIRVPNPYGQQQQQYANYPGQNQPPQWAGQQNMPPGMPMPPGPGVYGGPQPQSGPPAGPGPQPPYPGMPMPGRPDFGK
jgi:hypothetical protein